VELELEVLVLVEEVEARLEGEEVEEVG